MSVDIDEIAAVNAGCHKMCIPNAVEHGPLILVLAHSSWSQCRPPVTRWTGACGGARNLGIESGKIKSKKSLACHPWQKIGEDEC
jgi:hypothetical protein